MEEGVGAEQATQNQTEQSSHPLHALLVIVFILVVFVVLILLVVVVIVVMDRLDLLGGGPAGAALLAGVALPGAPLGSVGGDILRRGACSAL